ncbi:hypothetical protein [Desulforegula conservatrix]|uniref:hypothetical protein n=1 Tax=Desulforegula conservatrix TaxID=153026 RepID=UPI000684362C|nr:hypothetical protein [Desulforegula conservatrix]
MKRKRRKRNLLETPHYLEFCARYQDNLLDYMLDNSSEKGITLQQFSLAEAISKPGCRVSVASGHGTGKSFTLATVCDWHLRVYPRSNALLTATNIKQVTSVVWKELDGSIDRVERNYPFLRGYFIKQAQSYYQADYKDSWYVLPKTASKSAPENLAGQHNDNYLCIVDEASAVDDTIHGVLRGALTNKNNRYVMVSQPTRSSGHFYDSHHELKESIYKAFNFNSEESPLVDVETIREKLIEYGGHHSPEYQIKVLGVFPDNLAGYLIPRHWCEQSQHLVILHEEAWGYVMTIDVAEGVFRDSSVYNIWKVSGFGDSRKVEWISGFSSKTMNEKEFARHAYNEAQKYQDITIAVDADGPGRTVILEMEELGQTVEYIKWGLPCHSKADQKRYKNQRAYASVKAREAIFDGRMRLQPGQTILDQASRIPYKLNDRGQYEIMSKDQMRSQGIKSPDEFDTACFTFLCDYTPLESSKSEETNKYLQWAREALEGKAS